MSDISSSDTTSSQVSPSASASEPRSDTPSDTRSDTPPVWRIGLVTGIVASVATTLIVLVAEALGVPMEAAPQTAAAGEHIPLTGYAMTTLVSTAIGTLIAAVLMRKAKHPAPTFVVITVVLTIISFAGPHTTGHATTATRLVLDLTHVVAALIVIPALARQLATRPVRR